MCTGIGSSSLNINTCSLTNALTNDYGEITGNFLVKEVLPPAPDIDANDWVNHLSPPPDFDTNDCVSSFGVISPPPQFADPEISEKVSNIAPDVLLKSLPSALVNDQMIDSNDWEQISYPTDDGIFLDASATDIESCAVDVASTSTNYRSSSFVNDGFSSNTTDASSGVTKCSSVTSVPTNKLKRKTVKVKRPCPFCKSFIRNFSEHLKFVHKDEPAVKEIKKFNKFLAKTKGLP